ncbi:MAG: zinc transporter permease subunit ZnuB [Pseudomonadota bacterium]|jgi:zinc transport system permease protein
MLNGLFTYDFLIYALLAGSGIACIAGPLGSIMIWQRMANFGDALAHATLLGLTLSLLFHFNIYLGLVGTSLLIAIFLSLSTHQKSLDHDTLLVIVAQTTLAAGLIVASGLQEQGVRVDLLSYLYGDILAIQKSDLWVIGGTVFIALCLLKTVWHNALTITLQEDLAKVEGISIPRTKVSIVLLMALVFAIAVKLIGVLLITTLFVVPAAAARQLAKSPEQMAVLASIIGIVANCGGIMASYVLDIPTGPSIVITATLIFVGLYAFKIKQA